MKMGLKSSKSGILPGYLCCPSKLEEFCDTLAETDKEDTEKKKEISHITSKSNTFTNGTIHRQIFLAVREMG